MIKYLGALFAVALALSGPAAASAAPIFYTNEASFDAAIGGAVLSFESFESNFADGVTSVIFPGVTVSGDENLVRTDPSSIATHGTSTIGIVDIGSDGNFVTFSFDSPVNAVSLYVLDPLDTRLTGTLTLSNNNGASQLLFSAPLPDLSQQFVGLIDTAATFSSITVSVTQEDEGIEFDSLRFGVIDFDAPTSVPEPSTLLLLFSSLAAIGVARRRRRP